MLLLLLETLTSRWLRIWTSHMLSSTPKKKKNPTPQTTSFLPAIMHFFSSIILSKTCIINSKSINLIWTLPDINFTTGKLFSTQPFPRFYSIPQLIRKVSFLLISSFPLEWQDCYAAWQFCFVCTALSLNSASSLAGLHHLLTGWEILSRGFTGTHLILFRWYPKTAFSWYCQPMG